ncbi:MAG: hypothetical protein JWM10_2128, partial [Myxococcaceae bacterium]|nr:hypothetical protein [Myxococcaceae bacterium]
SDTRSRGQAVALLGLEGAALAVPVGFALAGMLRGRPPHWGHTYLGAAVGSLPGLLLGVATMNDRVLSDHPVTNPFTGAVVRRDEAPRSSVTPAFTAGAALTVLGALAGAELAWLLADADALEDESRAAPASVAPTLAVTPQGATAGVAGTF